MAPSGPTSAARGRSSCACVAAPPSPDRPGVPVPATVVMIELLSRAATAGCSPITSPAETVTMQIATVLARPPIETFMLSTPRYSQSETYVTRTIRDQPLTVPPYNCPNPRPAGQSIPSTSPRFGTKSAPVQTGSAGTGGGL